MLSRRVLNGESELSEVIDATLKRASTVVWAIDLADGPAALMITLLLERGQRLLFQPGVVAICGSCTSRRKRSPICACSPRSAPIRPRTRSINRLRQRLLSVFPALERALDFTNQGPLVLISHFQTPRAIRAIGADGLEHGFAAARFGRSPSSPQQPLRPRTRNTLASSGESMAAALVGDLASNVLDLDRQLTALDKLIATRFRYIDTPPPSPAWSASAIFSAPSSWPPPEAT